MENEVIIYCIKNMWDKIVYIGSTSQPLQDRFKQHLKDSNTEKVEYLINFKCYIEEITKTTMANRFKLENDYIKIFKIPLLNKRLNFKDVKFREKIATKNCKHAIKSMNKTQTEKPNDNKRDDSDPFWDF